MHANASDLRVMVTPSVKHLLTLKLADFRSAIQAEMVAWKNRLSELPSETVPWTPN